MSVETVIVGYSGSIPIQLMRKQKHLRLATKNRMAVLLVVCLLGGGACRFLGAQTVNVSVWSSEMDHSLESVLVFQSQSRVGAQANIRIYDDIPAQQIAELNMAPSSGYAAQPAAGSAASEALGAEPSLDREADTLIIYPLQSGAVTLRSAAGSSVDFLLMTQLFRAVKPKAYRILSGVTGSDDLESVAFRNPDGTYALFTVNHSKSPISLEVFWKDRLLTCTQPGGSVAIFDWDPKGPLVTLVPGASRISAAGEDYLSVEAKCSKESFLGIDLRCESQTLNCFIFPIRFTCNSHQKSVILSVAAYSKDKNDINRVKPGFVTITATPDVGEPTILRLPCCSADR